MKLPADHAQRIEVNDEVHARPPDELETPVRLSYLVLLSPSANREREWRHVCALTTSFGVQPPSGLPNHLSADLGPFRLKWERHTEFVRYTFIVAGANSDAPFASPAIDLVPEAWLAAVPGETIVAAHAAMLQSGRSEDDGESLRALFEGNVLIGSAIAEGAAAAFTDFRIHQEGFSRFLVRNRNMSARQAGRAMQRLLEIDTYRMMALLALPLAREASAVLLGWERELAQITDTLAAARAADEPELLRRLTLISAAIESRTSANNYRFGAAAAYYELVQRRIRELREQRIPGLQTFQEFIGRRLAPAMNTCRSVAARQEDMAHRVARSTQLLSTRVDVTREQQNQELLASMNRRAATQLRLQSTVEGLSIAAVTYYVVGLIGYGAKAISILGIHVNPELAMGASIPIVALLMAFGIRKVRRIVGQH